MTGISKYINRLGRKSDNKMVTFDFEDQNSEEMQNLRAKTPDIVNVLDRQIKKNDIKQNLKRSVTERNTFEIHNHTGHIGC